MEESAIPVAGADRELRARVEAVAATAVRGD
jgi:hypothetical protein